MLRTSLHRKIVALLVAALGICQIATLIVVLIVTRHSVEVDLQRDLSSAEAVFQNLFEQRYLQLLESVNVLGADFGFKRAAASGDAATIMSALDNHGKRAGAAMSVLVSPDGQIAAASPDSPDLFASRAWSELVDAVIKADAAAHTLRLQSAAYQLVAVPVLAPHRIGWLFMGFAVDNELAAEFKRLTGRDVSFVSVDAPREILASTVSVMHWPELNQALIGMPKSSSGYEIEVGELEYLTRVHPVDRADPAVAAVLQDSLSDALAPYTRLALQLAGLFVVTLLLACVAGVMLVRGITGPIRGLVEAAKRIGEGNYATEIDIQSDDEVGQLASTLESMQFEISEREHRIVHQAHHDDLTGLPNRWLANDRLNGAMHRARRSGVGFTVAQIDLSRFKHINDTFGHHIGDVVLKETAARLASRLRRSDTVARLGGDDFFLILESTDLEAGVAFIEKIYATLIEPVALDKMSVSLDFRCGIAAYPEHADDAASLMRRAEIAMYDAKDSHQRMVTYETGRDDGNLRQLAIVADIGRALEQDELSLHYQPKVDTADGGTDKAEALVRWIHPNFGFIPPDEFVAVLEEAGNITILTRWVITRATQQARQWLASGIDIKISINLSAMDLLNEALPEILINALSAAQLPTSQIALEITESAVMRDPRTAMEVLGRLRTLGFSLSIDDFGTGYSSLAQLKSLPVSELKIDKSFVMQLASGSEDAMIVKSTIDLAHSMGLKVVAEGVETIEAWQMLKAWGCEVAQGYLISKPLPAGDFENWLREARQADGSIMVAAA